MSSRSLLDLQVGEHGCIKYVRGQGPIRQRLLDMGLLPLRKFRLERIAPGGAPIWIQLDSTHLALRREEAAMIVITDSAANVSQT